MLLKPKPPYNFELSLDFMMLKDGSGPFPERRIGNEVLRAFRINNKVIPARIIFVGSVNKPELKVTTPNISSTFNSLYWIHNNMQHNSHSELRDSSFNSLYWILLGAG